MIEYNEVKISRILNPTSINLGDFVINPFMGCEYACLYCYVRSNRVVSRKNKAWGEYVDIRINAPERLEKELLAKKPKTVLLGSTTECFQPIENKYCITKKILEILNKNKIHYVILTRSPYIINYIYLLKEGFCKTIYFSINNYKPELKKSLEPKSPAFELRDAAVSKLLAENIPVIPYFSPIIPYVSDYTKVFEKFHNAKKIEFECLNFCLNNIKEIIEKIIEVEPSLRNIYFSLLEDKHFYDKYWNDIKTDIHKSAIAANKGYNIYIHNFNGYFQNKY